MTRLVLRTYSLRATRTPVLPFVHSLLACVAALGPGPDVNSLVFSVGEKMLKHVELMTQTQCHTLTSTFFHTQLASPVYHWAARHVTRLLLHCTTRCSLSFSLLCCVSFVRHE